MQVLISSTCALTGNQCNDCRHILVVGLIYNLSNLTQAIGRLRPSMRDSDAEVVQYVHASEDSQQSKDARTNHDRRSLLFQRIQGLIETDSLTTEQQSMARQVFSFEGYYRYITETRGCLLRALSMALGCKDSDRSCLRCSNCLAATRSLEAADTLFPSRTNVAPTTNFASEASVASAVLEDIGSIGGVSLIGHEASLDGNTNQYINALSSSPAVSPLAERSLCATPNKKLFASDLLSDNASKEFTPNNNKQVFQTRKETASCAVNRSSTRTSATLPALSRKAGQNLLANRGTSLQTSGRKTTPGRLGHISAVSSSRSWKDAPTVTSQGTRSIVSFFRRGHSSPLKSKSPVVNRRQRPTDAAGKKRPPAASPSVSVSTSTSRRGLDSTLIQSVVRQIGSAPFGAHGTSHSVTNVASTNWQPESRQITAVRKKKTMRLNGTSPLKMAARRSNLLLETRQDDAKNARLLLNFFLGDHCPFCGDDKYDARRKGTPGCKCLRCSIPKYQYCHECGLFGHGQRDRSTNCPLHKGNIARIGMNFARLMSTAGVCQRCMLPGCRLVLEKKGTSPCRARRGMFLLWAD